jgi:hypothetical protein
VGRGGVFIVGDGDDIYAEELCGCGCGWERERGAEKRGGVKREGKVVEGKEKGRSL